MNARHCAFAAIILLGIPGADAQNATPDAPTDPIQTAIRKFNENRAHPPNEVTVVLDPVGIPPAPVAKEVQPEPARAKPSDPAVPATGPTAVTPPSPPGLAVRVEKLQVGTGSIDPAQVKLLAPFPAKPLTPPPPGWSLQSSPTAPPYTREVELSPGSKITLTVHPHILVPDTDGGDVFEVPEPGFEAALGYRQNATLGAILAHSLRQLDDDARKLGTTIDQLQQILVSLPKSPSVAEPMPNADPAEARKPTTPRKR